MPLTAAILINVALDLAIIAGLAFVLTRAGRLAPQFAAATTRTVPEPATSTLTRAPSPAPRSLSARRRLAATAR
jgi:hypothetical protein